MKKNWLKMEKKLFSRVKYDNLTVLAENFIQGGLTKKSTFDPGNGL
jgi:hypothetical protein